MKVQARAYQTKAIAHARSAFVRGRRAVLIVAPTGAGKTTIGALIVEGRIARGGRVAWFAHRRELVKQAADRLRLVGLDVGAEGLNADAPVQCTSVQTVLARGELPPADLVVLDEAHHYVSDEWRKVAQTYLDAGAMIVGLTATPERADGRGLGGDGGIFDELVLVAQIAELVELWRVDDTQGLVPCEVLAPTSSVRKLACEPVEAYERHARGRKAVVFAPHVKAAYAFAADFKAKGIPAGVVHGDLSDTERDSTLRAFELGELAVVVNVMVLTEGWDCPTADVCILARKIGSPSLYLQCVGRVLRPATGKRSALLIDLVGAVAMHGKPDEERIYALTGPAVRRRGDARVVGDRTCRVCSTPIPPEADRCPECDTPASELVVPHGEGVELDRFEWAQRADTDKRVRCLVKWRREALAKGHSLKSPDHKYRAVFKRFPESDVRAYADRELARDRALAEAFVRAFEALRRWAPTCPDPIRDPADELALVGDVKPKQRKAGGRR